jgi:hypothetical protein
MIVRDSILDFVVYLWIAKQTMFFLSNVETQH